MPAKAASSTRGDAAKYLRLLANDYVYWIARFRGR
jgi:ketosteroid isomerase-like protein